MKYRYTVKATFQSSDVAQEWVQWLQYGHCADVLKCGATKVELVAIDNEEKSFEVRYVFASRAAFLSYEDKHASRLRQEGLALFPAERGITYFRTTGTVIYQA